MDENIYLLYRGQTRYNTGELLGVFSSEDEAAKGLEQYLTDIYTSPENAAAAAEELADYWQVEVEPNETFSIEVLQINTLI